MKQWGETGASANGWWASACLAILHCGGLAVDCPDGVPCGAAGVADIRDGALAPSGLDASGEGLGDTSLDPALTEPSLLLPAEAPVQSLCPNGGTLGDPLRPSEVQQWTLLTQGQINGLTGCERVLGSLTIVGEFGTDLSALSQLRIVEGTFRLQGTLSPDNPLLPRLNNLDALARLERVGSLALSHLDVPSLAPLSNLTSLGPTQDEELLDSFRTDGISVFECDRLEDLTGLHNVPTYRVLRLDGNDRLRSFSQLQPQDELNEFDLIGNPRLVDLAFAPRLARTTLTIADSAFEDLSGLSNLIGAGGVYVLRNAALRSLDGLRNLEDFRDMDIAENALLQQLPVWENVTDFGTLRVRLNPALEIGPSFPALERIARGRIFVAGNSRLVVLNGFATLQRARSLEVSENARLQQLDLSSLQTVSRRLEVRCNPQLPNSAVEPLAAVSSEALVLELNGAASAACEMP